MEADFSIELGREDPMLNFPWRDPSGEFAYVNLKRDPQLLSEIPEAQKFPELAECLRQLNSPKSILATAKCDAWLTTDLNAEEEVYGATHKVAGYIDAVFTNPVSAGVAPAQNADRESFPAHEQFAKKLVELLRRVPETPSSLEVCVRRCFFSEDPAASAESVREGFYFTLYVSGYGDDGATAGQNWEVGLKLLGNAIMQLSAGAHASTG
jgi:hypothetical protein